MYIFYFWIETVNGLLIQSLFTQVKQNIKLIN